MSFADRKKAPALPGALIAAAALLLAACSGGARDGIVSVSGVGMVRAEPDTVSMSIAMRHTAPTTRAAQAEVSAMARQALEILREAGVEERSIGTAALRFSPEYDWGPQGRRLLGQRAEQAISFYIEGMGGPYAPSAPDIIDRLIGINGIELQGMSFSVRDAAELRRRARDLAYADALEKALQYAELAGRRIIRTAAIAEEGAARIAARQRAFGDMAQAAPAAAFAGEAAYGIALPAGEIEVSARIQAEFVMR